MGYFFEMQKCIFRFLLVVPERLWENESTKIILNGSPRGRFEHSGVLPGAKLHAEHDGNSEIINFNVKNQKKLILRFILDLKFGTIRRLKSERLIGIAEYL